MEINFPGLDRVTIQQLSPAAISDIITLPLPVCHCQAHG